MLRPTQTARQRELFRYFQPPSVPLLGSGKAVIRSSNDPTLTSFARLGALQLNAKQGIISLVGRDTEYVIAEAGKTLSLQGGMGAPPSNAAIGLVVIDLLTGISQNAIPHLVVNDLHIDGRFNHLPLVMEEPYARFLACFPLRTPAGHVIGLYTIIDDQPRELSDLELQFLRDMARTAMGHIESGRAKQQHHRAERMVKALGLFLEGKASLRNWWIIQGREGQNIQQFGVNENVRQGLSYSQQADEEFGVQDIPDRYSGTFGLNSLKGLPHNAQDGFFRSSQSMSGDGRPLLPSTVSNSAGTGPPTATDSDLTLYMEQESVTSDGPSISPGKQRHELLPGVPPNSDNQNLTSISGKRLQEALLSDELRRTFARASNLIREAIDAFGVAFFDASIGSFSAGSEPFNMNAKAPGAHTIDGKADTTSSSSGEEERRAFHTDTSNGNPSALPSENYVGILGYSTRTRSSINEHSAPEAHELFPESLLRHLAKRYPHGKIFNFEEDKTISTSDAERMSHADPQATPGSTVRPDESDNGHKKMKRLTLEEEAAGVLNVVPGARSVAWFPIWDSTLDRWYAGMLIWSKSVTRVFSAEEELTYMAAFGNSIMAEVSRLSALVASQMKVDFISSISHELRSPLHGILACAEFLKDDQGITDVNEDMIDTINNCGHTLLQTIDHVLDFSKITKKVKEKSSRSRTNKRLKDEPRARRRDMSNCRPMDLRILTEEVIDSVYAGRRSWKKTIATNPSDPSHQTSHLAPIIIVDISWRENWIFDMDDGAWRRILMNLFSNAVKYTKRGYVRIALNVEFDEIPGKKKPYPRLCLEVIDSGQGISQEFLKNHIYTPFKQEDALSLGTGLGLSIVRQIIHDLGGKIDIKSEVGVGTQAYVSIPLLPNKVKNLKGEDSVAEVHKNVSGSKACIVNSTFDRLPAMSDTTGIMSPEAEALRLLKLSIRLILIDWFGMEVITLSKLDLASANVHITTSSETLDEEIHAAKFNPSTLRPVTVIVVCSALSRNPNYVTKSGVQVFYLQQPVSPHKFAAVLSHIVYQPPSSTQDARKTLTKIESSSTKVKGITADINPSANAVDTPLATLEAVSPSMIPRSLPFRKASYDAASTSAPTHPLKILLVEDNEINLSLLVKCISKLQHPYLTATNGREAVEIFKSQGPFNVVILDIQMPIMDGFAATREIRKMERKERKYDRPENQGDGEDGLAKEEVTIIALTGASSDMAKQEAFAAGINIYLVKPVSMKALRDVLAGLEDDGRSMVGEEG